jgi:hypothetical protein
MTDVAVIANRHPAEASQREEENRGVRSYD